MTLSPPGDPEVASSSPAHLERRLRRPADRRLLKARAEAARCSRGVGSPRTGAPTDDDHAPCEAPSATAISIGTRATVDHPRFRLHRHVRQRAGDDPQVDDRVATRGTWTAFLYRTDAEGMGSGRRNATDAAKQCINDAGERARSPRRRRRTRVYVDSRHRDGKPGTGGDSRPRASGPGGPSYDVPVRCVTSRHCRILSTGVSTRAAVSSPSLASSESSDPSDSRSSSLACGDSFAARLIHCTARTPARSRSRAPERAELRSDTIDFASRTPLGARRAPRAPDVVAGAVRLAILVVAVGGVGRHREPRAARAALFGGAAHLRERRHHEADGTAWRRRSCRTQLGAAKLQRCALMSSASIFSSSNGKGGRRPEEHVEHDAERPDVRTYEAHLAPQHLGAHVARRCPPHRSRARRRQPLREPKVGDDDLARASESEVLRFDVAVDDAHLVERGEPAQRGAQQLAHLVLGVRILGHRRRAPPKRRTTCSKRSPPGSSSSTSRLTFGVSKASHSWQTDGAPRTARRTSISSRSRARSRAEARRVSSRFSRRRRGRTGGRCPRAPSTSRPCRGARRAGSAPRSARCSPARNHLHATATPTRTPRGHRALARVDDRRRPRVALGLRLELERHRPLRRAEEQHRRRVAAEHRAEAAHREGLGRRVAERVAALARVRAQRVVGRSEPARAPDRSHCDSLAPAGLCPWRSTSSRRGSALAWPRLQAPRMWLAAIEGSEVAAKVVRRGAMCAPQVAAAVVWRPTEASPQYNGCDQGSPCTQLSRGASSCEDGSAVAQRRFVARGRRTGRSASRGRSCMASRAGTRSPRRAPDIAGQRA